MRIEQIRSGDASAKELKIYNHSHIKGLGLNEEGIATKESNGFIGQIEAREAAGIAIDLILTKRMAGRALLLAGPFDPCILQYLLLACKNCIVFIPSCFHDGNCPTYAKGQFDALTL